MMQHIHAKPTSPDLINPNVTPALAAVVLQSIAKDQSSFPQRTAMTVALTQAFGLPVPASLNKPGSMNEKPGYNPLQPLTPLPGMTPLPPTLTAAPPAPFTPASASYPESQFISLHMSLLQRAITERTNSLRQYHCHQHIPGAETCISP